jgi:hypothetical protein
MKKFFLAATLCLIAIRSMATPASYVPGTGQPDLVRCPDQADCWCEPADLNGLIGSSEQILSLGLDSEIANDFAWPPNAGGIGTTVWWGAFFNNSTPCASGIVTPGFNLRFYSDDGCRPGAIAADLSITDFTEESIGCRAGVYPLFEWSTTTVVNIVEGLYWFAPQMRDHAFAPQAGRLASASVVGCESVFRSAYFGFPDWTPVIDAFGVEVDFSQGFGGDPSSPEGACCIGSQCRDLSEGQCLAQGGRFLGQGTTCRLGNPCESTPAKSATWGSIRSAYR